MEVDKMDPGSRNRDDLPAAAVSELLKANKIEAIKILRKEQGIGLKEAKEAVEHYLESQPSIQRKVSQAQSEAVRGFLPWAAIIMALIVGAYHLLTAK